MADLPIKELGGEAPVYNRPFAESPKLPVIDPASVKPPMSTADALEKLIASPDLCSKRWVFEQYDHIIGGNTVQRPGGDAAVVRINEGPKALALTADVTPRYCEAEPYEGGKQVVAEAYRNLSAVGGRPLALTDNLNFGNPERPEIMGQLVGCIRGIGETARALDFPIVSGNVSLYNETNGRAILPSAQPSAVSVCSTTSPRDDACVQGGGELTSLSATPAAGWASRYICARSAAARRARRRRSSSRRAPQWRVRA